MQKIFTKIWIAMLAIMALPAMAQEVSYTLNPTVNPKSMSEVEKGALVTLDFGETAVVVEDDAVVTATPMNEVDDGYDVSYEPAGEAVSLPISVGSEGNVYFRFDVDGAAGTMYELKLARGTVMSEDGALGNMVKTWKYFVAQETTSIESILMNNNETVKIFNYQGICLKSNATIQDVRNLKSGLYIVNGKKIIVR